MAADRITEADVFLARSETLLTEPEPLAACAWCSHPLDDASPSGEFCGENCAWAWRTGMDWSPGHRCACRTCDPEGYEARQRAWDRRFPNRVEPRRLATPRPSPARGLFQVRPEVYREQVETGTAVHRTVEDYLDQFRVNATEVTRYATEHSRRRWFLGTDITTEESAVAEYFRDFSHDLPPAPMPPWLRVSPD